MSHLARPHLLLHSIKSVFCLPRPIWTATSPLSLHSLALWVFCLGTGFAASWIGLPYGNLDWTGVGQPYSPSNIPCLFVIERLTSPSNFQFWPACVTVETRSISWRRDEFARISGFDYILKDNQDNVFYQAFIDIQRDEFGRIRAYEGVISGTDFPTFTQTIVNEYESGFVARANITKTYTVSGDTYTMELIYCGFLSDWSGFKVNVNGEEFVFGDCDTNSPTSTSTATRTLTPTYTPTSSSTSTPTATHTSMPTATSTSTSSPTATPSPTATLTISSPPTGCYDLDESGIVDIPDVQLVSSLWRQSAGSPYDCDGNGFISVEDIMCVIGHLGESCDIISPTPTLTLTNTATSTPTGTQTVTSTLTYTSTPTATFTSTDTATSTPTGTYTTTPTYTPTPTEGIPGGNIPCLFVIEQLENITYGTRIWIGCIDEGSLEASYDRRRDQSGRIVGMDLILRDDQGLDVYQVSIDVQWDEFGRVESYGGTVSGIDFPTFTESIVNERENGFVTSADVTKTYVASGDEYTMQLIHCGFLSGWSGYKVKVWGEGFNGEEFPCED